MRTLALLATVLLIVSVSAAPVPVEINAVELIVNGGFEDGPEVEVYTSLDEKSDAMKGWIVTRGQIDYCGSHWRAAEGKRSLDLHGSRLRRGEADDQNR